MSNPPKNLGRGSTPSPLFGNAKILRALVVPTPPLPGQEGSFIQAWASFSTCTCIFRVTLFVRLKTEDQGDDDDDDDDGIFEDDDDDDDISETVSVRN